MVETHDRSPARRPPAEFSSVDQACVEQLWDDVRIARLSDLYYGKRISSVTLQNRVMDGTIAAAASTSGVAGWALWQSDGVGKFVWALFAGIAAVFAILKPLLTLDRKLTSFTKQQQVYRSVLSSLENLIVDIRQAGAITAEHRVLYKRQREKLADAQNNDETDPSISLRRELELQVGSEYPPDKMWMPAVSVARAAA